MEEETFTDINEDTEAAADPIGQADLASVMGDGGGPDITNPLTIATDETKNLDNQVELDDPLTLAINQASNIDTSLSPEVALLKAQRISQALGERSPGFDSLVSQYLDPTGTEESYNRQLVASDEDMRLQQEKNKMVNEIVNKKGSLTQFDYDLINGMSLEQFKQFKTNPSTVFEEAYGKAYIDKVVVKENERQNSPLAKWMRGEQPDKVGDTLDLASSFLAKQEIVADLHARVKKKWENSGLLSQTGDFLANFIPMAEQIRQFNRFAGSDSHSIFKGQNIQDQVTFAYGLDNATFKERLTMALEALMNGPTANLWLAWDFIDKFQQYSNSDQFTDSFWGLVDAASVMPFKTAGRLAGKVGAKGATQVAINTPTSRTVIQGDSRGVQQVKESLQKTLAEVPVTPFQANKTNPTQDVVGANQNYWDVWHGTPHKFDKPDVGKINTGEETQMEGWGLYATEEKSVADWYRKMLSSKGDIDDFNLEMEFSHNFNGYTFKELQKLDKEVAVKPKLTKQQVQDEVDKIYEKYDWEDGPFGKQKFISQADKDYVSQLVLYNSKDHIELLKDFRAAKEVYERILNKNHGTDAHKKTIQELETRITDLQEMIDAQRFGSNLIGDDAARSIYKLQKNIKNITKALLYGESLYKDVGKVQPGYVYNWGVKANKKDFIDLEKTLVDQPEDIKKKVGEVLTNLGNTDKEMHEILYGKEFNAGGVKVPIEQGLIRLEKDPLRSIYSVMSTELKQKFTAALKAKGLKGNTYIGESSSKRNYVFFDDSYLTVISRNGDPIQTISDVLKGYDPKEVNVKKVLNASGDTHGYTTASLTEQATGVKTIAAVNDNLPAPINPVANDINKGLMDAPVAPLVNARGQEYFNIIRLTEDAWDVAVQKTIDRMKEDITDSSSLLDVKVPNLPVYQAVKPTEARNNAGYVLHNVGDMHGELFDSAKHAEYYARNWYRVGDNSIDPVKGLPKGGFTIEQHGNGFYIQIKRYVDETHPDVRGKLARPADKQRDTGAQGLNERNPGWWDKYPLVDYILGNRMHLTKWLNTAARVADHQTQLINAYFDPERKILGALTKKEQKQFNQFLSEQQFKPNPNDPGKNGVAYDDIVDFEVAWQQMYNEMPSNKMTDAYFLGFRKLTDKEYAVRNDARVRDRARHGLEDWSVNTGVIDEEGKPIYAKFGGKRIDSLPKDTSLGDTGILIMKDDNTSQYLRLSKMTPEDRTKIQALIDDQKYRIIQLENHHQKPLKSVAGEEVVSYVVTKKGISKPISDKQINYNPGGGHVVYTDRYAVAQGQIVRIDDYAADGTKTTRHQYAGDRIVFSATSTDEMNRITKAMETARKLLLAGNDGALQAFLDSNLPFKLKQFKAHFNDVLDDNGKVIEKARWDKNVPFMGRDYGKLTIDQNPSGYAEFTNLENLFANKHSILTDIENKFVSERDPRVWRVIESGTWGTPDYRTQLGYANVMDPIAAMNKGIQAAVKSQYFKDYQVTALETFAATYLPFMKKEVRDNFYTDMTKYITRSDIWEVSSVNKDLLVGAENMRSAINNLISTQTENELREGIFRQKMENLAYRKKGQKGADFVSDFELSSTLDPRVFMPTIAYHAKIGMLNLAQYWTQLQTFVNLSAISGMTGIRTFGAMYPARLALFNPNMTDQMAVMASKVSSMTPDEFKDALRLMKAQGFDKVEGDHTWVHEILSNTNPYTKYGRLKEFSQLPFKEGEKATRIASFFSAYKEFVRDNPGKHIGTHEAQLILDRAGTLAGNMTKHANANWQRGWTNIPTQFWSVQARLAELLIGKELTGWEKARVMIGNSIMYGVPAGVLGTAIGVYPWTETVKGQFLESGVDITNPKVKVFLDGIPSALMQLMTGKDYDFTGKYGPQGIPFLRDLFVDHEFFKAIGGVSGALFGDMLKSTLPVLHYLKSNMTFSDDTDTRMPAPDMSDYVDALRSISSMNNGIKAYMAFSLGKLVSKNEIYLADVDTVDGIAAGIFGLTPRAIADVSLMARNLKYQKESQKVAEEQVTKYYRRAVEAYADGNRELGDRHLQAARVYLKLGEFQVPEMNRILGEARKGWESYEQRITHDFFLRKAPLSKVEERRNQFLNRGQ